MKINGVVRREIRSRVEADVLLHAEIRAAEVFSLGHERVDHSAPEEALQLSTIQGARGRAWPAHRHLVKAVSVQAPAQETWIVVAGEIEVSYYDLDDTLIERVILGPGDCSITYRGGHGYKVVSADAWVYEVKSGPYLGRELDKVIIP
jgi:hypothetical protein